MKIAQQLTMEPTQYYILFICGILLTLGFRGFWLSSGRSSLPYLKVLFARKIRYAALPRWVAITRLELLALLLYFGANSLALALGLPATDVRGFEKRAARLALVNMIPLFLGGLANRLADVVGIPLSLYHFTHCWVGRVVVVEALLHAALALALRPIPGQLLTSGYLSLSLFLALFAFSIRFLQRRLGGWFQIIHVALALTAVALTLWHVFLLASTEARVLVSSAGGLWALAASYRWAMVYFYGIRASVGEVWLDDRVVGFEVHIERPVHVLPGGYFYISLPGSIFRYHFFSSYPALALWRQTENSRSVQGIENVQDISFIIPRSKYTQRLDRLSKGQRILLHGPYGYNLRLESYENVILVAKGIGILGVLQHAFCIALRKAYDDRIREELRDIAEVEKTIPVDKRDLVERRKRLSLPGWNNRLPQSSDAISQRAVELQEIEEQLDTKAEVLSLNASTTEEQEILEAERGIYQLEKRVLKLKWDLLKMYDAVLGLAEKLQSTSPGRRQREKDVKRLATRNAQLLAKEKELVNAERDLLMEKSKVLRTRKDLLKAKPLFCDSTRQLDIFWILDENSQGIWVANEIEALKKLDPQHTLLVFFCMNPFPRTGSTPFKVSSHFSCLYPKPGLASFDKLILAKIQEETRSPGKVAVIGCGDSAFIQMIREGVVNSKRAIRFIETEFEPLGRRLPQQRARGSSREMVDIALGNSSSISLEDKESVV